MEESRKSFFDDNAEESAPLKWEELSDAERATIERMSDFYEELAKKQETQHQPAVPPSPRQRIVIKKLLCSGSHIRELGTDGEDAVKIPEGWRVKQIATTPIEKDGDTKHIALTMLLEKLL